MRRALILRTKCSSGANYDSTSATVIGNFPPGTTTLNTTTGLEVPGDIASFKVFVRLTTGNESGSNAVSITRP